MARPRPQVTCYPFIQTEPYEMIPNLNIMHCAEHVAIIYKLSEAATVFFLELEKKSLFGTPYIAFSFLLAYFLYFEKRRMEAYIIILLLVYLYIPL
jgi:hypothetical protein